MRGGGARSRIAPRVFSTKSCEEFPKTAGAALNRRHRPVPIANELRRGIKSEVGVHWGDSIAEGCRAAQVRARDALCLRFSETAQALRAATGGRSRAARRLVAAGRSLCEIVCVECAEFNEYDAAKHLQTVRRLAVCKTLASQPGQLQNTPTVLFNARRGHLWSLARAHSASSTLHASCLA